MKKKDTLYIFGIVSVVSILAISSFIFKGGTTPDYKELEGKEVTPQLLRGGEMRETMSPEIFTGRAALAYRYAKEIPEVFDSIYCYCGCERLLGHKSLLSCHVTDHSLYCDICQRQAIRTYELYKEGLNIVSIRKTIDKEFAVSLGFKSKDYKGEAASVDSISLQQEDGDLKEKVIPDEGLILPMMS